MTDDELDELIEAGAFPTDLEQRPGETALEYEALLHYLRLGRRRSIRAVAAAHGHDERWLERVSSKQRWAERLVLFERLRLRAMLRDTLHAACVDTKAA